MESEYRPGNRDDFDRLYRGTYTRVRFTLQGILRDATIESRRGWTCVIVTVGGEAGFY